MDFAFLSTLIPSLKAGISRVLVSYDIGCQWHKNLQTRLDQYAVSLPSNCTSSNTGGYSFRSSTSPGMETAVRSHLTSHTQSGPVGWTGSGSRVGGHKPTTWQPGPESVAHTLVATSLTTTGTPPIGGNSWDFMGTVYVLPHAPLTPFRYISGEEPSTVAHLEQISAGDCNYDVWNLPSLHHRQVAYHARYV
jgi:hypothetical protein